MKVQVVKDQADETTFEDWRNEDYMNKMEFSPLVMFVVIPTIVLDGIPLPVDEFKIEITDTKGL